MQFPKKKQVSQPNCAYQQSAVPTAQSTKVCTITEFLSIFVASLCFADGLVFSSVLTSGILDVFCCNRLHSQDNIFIGHQMAV